jgi:vancomycin permeability regulator SanA
MKNKKRKVKVIILVALILFAIASGLIIWDGLTDELGSADVGILFGNQVLPSGEPSARLYSRLNKAIDLYSDNYFEKIIVSGGLGKEGHDEALVMKEHLISQGIPENNILVDSNGLNTYMTVENSINIMEENNFTNAMVISNYFHLPRIKMACNRFGIESVYSAHAHYFGLRDLYSITREVIAYGYYLIRSYP